MRQFRFTRLGALDMDVQIFLMNRTELIRRMIDIWIIEKRRKTTTCLEFYFTYNLSNPNVRQGAKKRSKE